jgi:hypothetical protein
MPAQSIICENQVFNSGHRDSTLTPQEFAEFIDSLEYDEAPAAVADCADYDTEQ